MKDKITSNDLALTYVGSKSKIVTEQNLDKFQHYGEGKKQLKTVTSAKLFVGHLINCGVVKEKFKAREEKRYRQYLTCETAAPLLDGRQKYFYKPSLQILVSDISKGMPWTERVNQTQVFVGRVCKL